jgi:P27 family predicted phage terminase small subunit
MPETILGNVRAVAHWERHAAALIASGRLHDEQAETFALLCEVWADVRRFSDLLLAEGDIIATDKGQAPHPAARMLRDARRDYVAMAKEFGLTAASDSRLPAGGGDGEEGDDEEAALRAFTG